MDIEENISPEEVLKRYWGHSQFRYPQREIIQSVLEGNNVLVLLPTGGGKSICFQIPALLKEGICLVISPLIALMKDQVEQLNGKGIKAYALFSGMSKKQIDLTLDNCVYGNGKFLYLSPERLKSDLFLERAKKMNISLIAVDEAHCISQWGYDFRPSYLEIEKFTQTLPDVPVMALTASATPEVEKDISDKLGFADHQVFRKSFSRENLTYSVFNLENRESKLLDVLVKVPGSSIVYVRSRNKTRMISDFLNSNGVSSEFYHGGLDHQQRLAKQELWTSSRVRVMVATNAFGMGIDKADVRSVIHMDVPQDIESYYQEAGRGGRDGHRAYSVILYNDGDLKILKSSVEQSNPSLDEVKRTYQALANYLKIAVGSAHLSSYEFDLEEFTRNFKLERKAVYYSIKALELMGLVELTDSLFSQSQVTLLVKNEDVYRFEIEHKEFEGILKSVLRLYGGEIYQNYASIQEEDISRLVKKPVQEVKNKLRKLRDFSILDYHEKSKLPKMTFLTPRLHLDDLESRSKILQERRDINLQKVESVINYVQNTSECRTRQLVSYFGEELSGDCGYCDYCLKKKNTFDPERSAQIRTEILENLEKEAMTLERLYSRLASFKRNDVNNEIRVLLDLDKIQYRDNDIMELKVSPDH